MTSTHFLGRPSSCPGPQELGPLATDMGLKCLLMEKTILFYPDPTPPSGATAAENPGRKANVYTHPVGRGNAIKDVIGSIEERIVSMLNLLKLIIYYGYVREYFCSE